MSHNDSYKEIVKDWLHSIVSTQETYKFEYKKVKQNFCLYCKTETKSIFCSKFCSLVFTNNDYYNILDCNIIDMFNFELLTKESQNNLVKEIKSVEDYQSINVTYIPKKNFIFETYIRFIKSDNTYQEKIINLQLIFDTKTSVCFLCKGQLKNITSDFKKSFCCKFCFDVFVFHNYNHYPYTIKLNNKLCRLEYFKDQKLLLEELKKKIQNKKYTLTCYINKNNINILLLLSEK